MSGSAIAAGAWEEAVAPSVLDALAEAGVERVAEDVLGAVRERGVSFRGADGLTPFHVDPVPRAIERAEWDELARGLRQRADALNAFIADVYGEREIVSAGVVPARVIESADHFEPWMLGVEAPGGHAPVIGFDVVRREDGRFAVLEDNLRTPSGLSYAFAAREALAGALPVDPPAGTADPADAIDLLEDALVAAAPDGIGDPAIALLSDGPENSAWFEHRDLSRRLDVPIVTRRDLFERRGRLSAWGDDDGGRPIDVLLRRTAEERLRGDGGAATWLADLLLEPIRKGTLTVVNAFGAGVADDKLAHAYVEAMIRFYLGEEPSLPSVRTYDLCEPDGREAALERLDELVVKPRSGHGGHGVVLMPLADEAERAAARRAVRDAPEDHIAQEMVLLSTHPTVCDGRLEPRHVDLRAFAVGSGVAPGGLTRVALEPGSLVVNTSQTGGGKDTWVLP